MKTILDHPRIGYTDQPTEFEIQAELYLYLKENNMNIKGEVNASDYINTSGTRFRRPRFDLVVYDWENNEACIIEIKKVFKHQSKSSRKYLPYLQYGVPVICVYGDTNFQSVLHLCSEIINSNKQPQMYRI